MPFLDVTKLRQAIADAKASPEHFSMRVWLDRVANEEFFSGTISDYFDSQGKPLCGTTLCLAGWVCHRNRSEALEEFLAEDGNSIRVTALKLLTNDEEASNDLSRLFSATWPSLSEVEEQVEELIRDYKHLEQR